MSDYNCVFEGTLSDISGRTPDEQCNAIYEKFNLNRPTDFKGYSLSVSDVITIGNAQREAAYYVDSFGFTQLDRFLSEHTPEQQAEPPVSANLQRVVDAFGVDAQLLEKLVHAGKTESNLNEYGYYDQLKETIDKEKAAAFISRIFNEDVPMYRVNARTDKLLREFILSGGETFASLPSEVDTNINFSAQARAEAMTEAEKTAFLNQTETTPGGAASPADIALNDYLTKELIARNNQALFHTLLQESGYTQILDNPFAENGLLVLRSPDGTEQAFDGYELANHFLSEQAQQPEVDIDINFSENREAAAPQPTMPQNKHRLTRAEQLYRQFAELFPALTDGTHSYERYGRNDADNGDEPLSVEHLGGCEYGFMTYYVQNGDVMRDPDFTFALDHENQRLILHEYQQDGVPGIGTLYQRVFDDNGNADEKLLAALEETLMQNIKAAKAMERQLTKFIDRDGSSTTLGEEEKVDTSSNFSADSNDATPELRAVLNAFSEKHGLGALHVTPGKYDNWTLSETMQDGAVHTLAEIQNPEYGMPFTPISLQDAFGALERQLESRGQSIAERFDRRASVLRHGGISALPHVRENLPEIAYASKPSMKISDNISAIRELRRLEEAERLGQPLYNKRSNQYNSQQASAQRLRKYCGWGGLPQVFDERFQQYAHQRKQLQELLSPEEYASARESTLNAHYTPQMIIDAMYKAVKSMDLPRESRVLEPACGTGNFISRLPHSLGNA